MAFAIIQLFKGTTTFSMLVLTFLFKFSVIVFTGECFPSDGWLAIEAVWGKEKACTDAVSSSSSIEFNQEIAFAIKKNDYALKKNIPIKIHFTIGTFDGNSELGTIKLYLKEDNNSRVIFCLVNLCYVSVIYYFHHF